MRISDWSSDVCSSDLTHPLGDGRRGDVARVLFRGQADHRLHGRRPSLVSGKMSGPPVHSLRLQKIVIYYYLDRKSTRLKLQSLMRISYAVFCLTKQKLIVLHNALRVININFTT